ncbi:MAG: hypothetical protein WCL32_05490 [Planctomycetota bacterium]
MLQRCWKTLLFFGLLGCRNQPSTPPAAKVQVDAPGVQIDVDKKSGKVQIHTPNANINVNPK